MCGLVHITIATSTFAGAAQNLPSTECALMSSMRDEAIALYMLVMRCFVCAIAAWPRLARWKYCSKLSEYAGWRNDHALNIFFQSCPKISKLHRNGRSKGMCSSIANYLICRNRWNTRPWSTALFGSSSNAPLWDSGQFFCSLERHR